MSTPTRKPGPVRSLAPLVLPSPQVRQARPTQSQVGYQALFCLAFIVIVTITWGAR